MPRNTEFFELLYSLENERGTFRTKTIGSIQSHIGRLHYSMAKLKEINEAYADKRRQRVENAKITQDLTMQLKDVESKIQFQRENAEGITRLFPNMNVDQELVNRRNQLTKQISHINILESDEWRLVTPIQSAELGVPRELCGNHNEGIRQEFLRRCESAMEFIKEIEAAMELKEKNTNTSKRNP